MREIELKARVRSVIYITRVITIAITYVHWTPVIAAINAKHTTSAAVCRNIVSRLHLLECPMPS